MVPIFAVMAFRRRQECPWICWYMLCAWCGTLSREQYKESKSFHVMLAYNASFHLRMRVLSQPQQFTIILGWIDLSNKLRQQPCCQLRQWVRHHRSHAQQCKRLGSPPGPCNRA
jgi:hypothetical protein